MHGPYQLEYARLRLLFKHPFGTAHGTRDGTDAVFVRLSGPDVQGYGEATLPPYVDEGPEDVIKSLKSIDIQTFMGALMKRQFDPDPALRGIGPAARAALSTAGYDLMARAGSISVAEYLSTASGSNSGAFSTVTLALGSVANIEQNISQLPQSGCLKIKLGGENDRERLRRVQACDNRPLFLDANQGWTDVAQALRILEVIDPARLLGVEQPFGKDRWDLHAKLQTMLGVPVYADESIQGPEDLERAVGVFEGVNIKLMKCGGLDVALAMAKRAKELGLEVMLGCMSESSLGCSAMAQLQGMARVVDLDGPWLIKNDPFTGLGLEEHGLTLSGSVGLGVELQSELDWIPVGA